MLAKTSKPNSATFSIFQLAVQLKYIKVNLFENPTLFGIISAFSGQFLNEWGELGNLVLFFFLNVNVKFYVRDQKGAVD